MEQQEEIPQVLVVGKIIVDEYGSPSAASDTNNGEVCCGKTVTNIGGGAPQAALGAAFALVARSYYHDRRDLGKQIPASSSSSSEPPPPPPQPVVLLAPVGALDFTSTEERALKDILKGALRQLEDDDSPPYHLIRGPNLITPRLRVWHTPDQIIQWQVMNDSFGSRGADSLWQHPSTEDYHHVLQQMRRRKHQQRKMDTDNDMEDGKQPAPPPPPKPIVHVLMEGKDDAPGRHGNSQALLDPSIRRSISWLGIEPIVFPDSAQDEGRISSQAGQQCATLLQRILSVDEEDYDHDEGRGLARRSHQKAGTAMTDPDTTTTPPPNHSPPTSPPPMVVMSPDLEQYQAMMKVTTTRPTDDGHDLGGGGGGGGSLPVSSSHLDSWTVRDGARGSDLIIPAKLESSSTTTTGAATTTTTTTMHIPAVSLLEDDGSFVNPTGAGNAYAAAYTALRGSGSDALTSACIATAVGAAFCRYPHCPPYTWHVIERIVADSHHIRSRVDGNSTNSKSR